jgi:hypothetical protein
MRFFGLEFFHESIPHRPLMNAWKCFGILFWLGWDIHEKEETFRVKSAENRSLPRITPWKGMPFRSIICRKLKNFPRIIPFWLATDFTEERDAFPQYNTRKVLPFCGIYRGEACRNLECWLKEQYTRSLASSLFMNQILLLLILWRYFY